MKAGSVLALGFFQSVLDRSKSPEESCWNTSILQRISAPRGFREGLFILPKNDDWYMRATWSQDSMGQKCIHIQTNISNTETVQEEKDFRLIQKTELQSMKKVRSWHLNMMQKTLLCTMLCYVFRLIVYVDSSHSVPWVQFFSTNTFVFFTQFKVEEISSLLHISICDLGSINILRSRAAVPAK